MAVAFPIHEDLFGFNLDRCEEILLIDAVLRASRHSGRATPSWATELERMFFQSDRGVSERIIDALNARLAEEGEEPLSLQPSDWTDYMRSRGPERVSSRQALRRALNGPERERLVQAAKADVRWLPQARDGAAWPGRGGAPAGPDPELARRRAAVQMHAQPKPATLSAAPSTDAPVPTASPAVEPAAPPSVHTETPAPLPAARPAGAGDQTELLLRIVEMIERLEAKVDALAARIAHEPGEGMEVVGGLAERLDVLTERIGALEGQSVAAPGAPLSPRASPTVVRDAEGRHIFAPGAEQPDV